MALTRPRYSQIPDTDWKQSVRAATTADVGNVMLAVMPSTVDGVTLNFYDRVLLRSQANAAQNGIYYVKAVGTGANGIWERTKDASSGGALGAVTPSIVTQVEEGTVNKNRTFKLTTTGNIDLGTTDLSFVVQAAEPAGATGQLQFANVNNVIGGATTTSYDYVTGNLVLTGNVNTTLLYQNGKRVPQVFTSANPPASPAVGDQWYQVGTDILYEWLQDGATAYWIDISGATIANINPITGQNIGTLVVNGGNDSTSTNTGALQVVGGVGITGNLNVGGSVSFGGGQLGSDLVISSNTTSISETTGAIRIASPGGLGVGGNIWAGGAIVANSRIPSTSILTGAIVVPGTGGLGVGGNVFVGQNLTVAGNVTGGGVRQTISSGAPASPVVGDQWYQLGTDILYQYVSDGTGSYWVDIAGATVANISPQSQQSLTDIQIVSGTPSTSTSTGALTVSGGVGIQGNLNLQGGFNISGGNIVANQNVTSIDTTTGSMVVTGQGGLGVGGNINAGGNLIVAQAASFLQNVIISANLVAGGTYFAAGGLSVTNGNVVASGTNAQIGGLTITSGAISGLSNLGVTGNITLGGALVATGDISTTGNITGGGLRKYAQVNRPTTPVVGDVWYKTDTDVFYQYVNDGTNTYWIDYAGATVANISPQTNQTLSDIVIVSGTPSTNTTSGALQVQGGAGITGNVFTGNLSTATVSAANFTYANGVSILEGNQGTYSNANVTAYLAASNISVGGSISATGNLTASGSYFSAGGLSVTAGNIVATGASAVIGGLTIENGGISSLASLNVIGSGTLGGDFAITGNITAGGLRKYAQVGAPANPIVGDVWYKTDTDVFYQYVNDGTNKYWIDYTSATVSNANPTSPQSLQDLQIVSGTPSTGSGTGALQVTGGAAVTGNVFAGNLSTATVSAGNFTFANGVSILLGNEGTYSNANVTAYLTARNVTITDGNITATGGYLAAGGFVATAGNIRTTSANIGGVIIESGGIGQLASLGVVGAATIGADLAVTGNITGGGLRKYAQAGVPTNPIVGDVWYKTDTDVYYQYINDGTNKYWVDFAGATVSNASITSSQIAYDIVVTTDTPSTSATTGAVRVQGGIGLIGNIFTTGIADFGGNLRAGNITANNNLQTNTLAVVQNATVGGTLNVTGPSTFANITTGNITGYGFATNAGNLTATGQYFSAGGLSVTAGNITATGFSATGGNIIATGNYAQIGGLTIQNGGFGSLASLDVTGSATFGANVDITGRVTGGGIRKTSSTTAPATPTVGDTWYKTDTDVYYTYVNDGTSSYWIDYVGATVSNAAVDNSTNNDFTIASGTASTDANTGALVVVGGVGVTGDINATGDLAIGGTFTADAGATVGYLNVTDGIDSYGNVIIHGPGTPNYTVQVRSSDAADDVFGIKTSVTGGGFSVDAMNNELTGATPLGISANTFSVGIKNSIGATVQADALKVNTAGNVSIAKTLSVGQHVNVTGNVNVTGDVNAGIGTFTSLFASSANLTTLNLSGGLTVSTLNVTTSIDAPGIRKYAQDSAPANPAAGDVWYKTNTDVYYTYVNDGTNSYWIDYVGATVSNAAVNNSVNQDFRVASGTESTNTDTGALTVVGGVGVVGNIFAGGIVSAQGQLRAISGVQSTNTTTGALVITGGLGVSANTNIGGALAADSLRVAGPSNLFGNLSGTNMSLSGRADIIGSATIGGNLDIAGAVTGGGIRKTTSATAPASPIVGDLWYKTDTDVLYQYINDGANNYWVDYVGATVSNASITSSQIAYDIVVTTDTPSTSTTTGAVRVQGGIGLIGNIFTTGIADIGGNLRAGNITANNNVQTNTLQVIGDTNLNKLTAVGNITSSGTYFSAGGLSVTNGNLVATGTTATIGGVTIENGGLGSLASLDVIGLATFGGNVNITESVNVTKDIIATGNITGGGLRKYAQDSAPANPVVGDVWYKTDTDVFYQYVNDGTNKYWIDFTSATVSNASPVTAQSLQNLEIVSVTPSTSTTTGAIIVAGGVGVAGNINAGNVSATNVSAGLFTYANGVSILEGNQGTYSNANVTAYLTARNTTISDGFLSTAGMTVTAGNLRTASANIGGVVIEAGGIGSLASLNVIGGATIGGDIAITGNVTGGGIRKTTSSSAPVNPVVGDLWYKTDTDVLYQYINDGTSKYWVDYVGATVSNAAVTAGTATDYAFTSGTPSTSTATGAVVVTGGIGLTGDLFTTGLANFGGNVTVNNLTSNLNIQASTMAVVGNLVTGNLVTGIATITRADIAGALTVGSDVTITGNVTGGGIRKSQSTTAPVNPSVGDQWYKTDSDVLYQYINDGTNKYWIDFAGATVSNAVVQNSTDVDTTITSGTESTNTTSGALTIVGGIGVTGNINAGNVIATSFRADNFLFANGNTLADRITGTYSNTNVAAYLTGSITTGNINAGNIATTDIIARNVTLSGNITGGGLRKYAQAGAPANPILGDVWYKTDTDVYYQYINDGANYFWVDYVGPTVSNAAVQNGTNSDFAIASGTLSTSPTTGALVVTGGVGVTGNIYTTGIVDIGGNLRADNVTANNNLQTNTLAVVQNATIGGTLNVTGAVATGNITTGNITAYGFTTNAGNLTATGAYLSAGGISATSGVLSVGNIISGGTRAVVGGLTIENGAFGNLASLGVIGSATIGGDVAITGNISAGGLRKYAQDSTPANPVVGDVWYKTDTDVFYQYVNDGTNKYWVDYVGATVSNASITSSQIAYDIVVTTDTPSTSTTTGAIRVQGGIGLIGNIFTTGIANFGGNLTAGNVTANNNLQTNTLSVTQSATVTGALTAGTLSAGNSSVGNIAGYGFTTNAGNLTATGAYFAAGGMSSTNGNITVGNISGYSFIVSNGNITSTGTYARVGGLEIINGGFTNLASLGVVGSATIGADLAVTGNITGGGLRKTQGTTPPANPVQGDVWYKTDTDVYYQYINDGTASYWIDYVSATVANITQNAATVSDLQIVSGTPSTSTSTGALTVAGGIGVTGDVNISSNVNVGNVNASTVYTPAVRATSYTYPNGASILDGYYFGTYSNANVGGYLTAQGIGTTGGNLTATGSYFSAGGLTVVNGNITATGTTATIGGLVIANGGFGSLASIGVIGSATIGGDVAITGNISAGGLRKYAQAGAPANPVVGDVWYKTDTDVYYQYITDGTANIWVDFVSATVANITAANSQYGTDVGFVSGTLSTTPQTGAVTVIGGVGVTGNINLTGQVTAAQQVQVQNLVSNTSIAGATLNISGATTIGGNLSVGNIVGYGFSTNNGNVTATGLLTVGSIAQIPGNLSATGSYFSAGGLTSLNGNITGTDFNITSGNVITTGLRAVVGGLTIENGAFGNVASLGVIGSANIGGDVVITGNITAGGVRKYAQANTPAYPIAGDVWYKTDADIFYTYVNDGTSTYWIDYTSAAIANITVANAQYGTDVGFVSGTTSTNQTNGAVTVIGGVGITGNINLTGRVTALDTVTGQAIVSNTSIAGATLSIAGDTAVGNLTAGNITAYGFSTNNGNVTATGKLTVGGLSVVPGNLSATGSYLSVNGFTALNGNITATGTTATIGGLVIANGGFGSIAGLDVIGSATIGGNVTVTGNITGGGIRKTTGLTAPVNPVVGDQWYKTDTDILYQFMNDGTSTYWVDFASATVANITNDFDGLGDFQTIGNVIGNGIVSDNYYYANGVSFVTTTVANTQNIVANITNGFNLGLDLTPTGVTAGNYGSATSIPTVVVDNKGRITSITSNAVSTTFGLVGNVGTSSINGGNTLVIVGTPNQISTTVSGNTISIGFTPNISFTDFTVNGNLIYQGGGIKTTTSPTPPPGPVSGDMWYQSGTDILYRYINDGTNEYWIDLFSTPLRAILPSQDIGGGDGEVQFNDNGTFGANANFAFDKTTGTLKVQRFRITQTQSPATPGSPGLTGEITWDGGWMYVCVAPNSWVRAGLYTW